MSLWSTALDWMFPPSCPGCAAPHPPRFCSACLGRIEVPPAPSCRCCGLPLSGIAAAPLCRACISERRYFRRAAAGALYAAHAEERSPLGTVLHRYKYGRELHLAGALGAVFAARFPFATDAYDLIVPVPLHLRRLRWRGFNQAQLLAETLAGRLGLVIDPFALERVRATPPQVGLEGRQRRRNVRGAFAVADRARVARRRVLLVDDVYTSGATTNECSRTLRAAGAANVDVFVLARAVA